MPSKSSAKSAWDKEKTRELFRRFKEEGDMDAREKLVMSHLNLVRFIANKFKNRGEPIDDLVQVGYLGLLKAIDRFDPSRGLEFTTFATPTIAEIAEYLDATVDEVLEAMESSSAYSSVSLEAPSGMDDDDTPSVIDRYATEDQELAFTDDRIIIEEALASFSPREREVIEMRFLQGMTQIEIAEKLGISQVQVSRLLRRTLKKIQEKIDPEGIMTG